MLRIAIAAGALLVIASSARPSRAAEREGAKKVSKEFQALAKSNNQFAFDVYGRLPKEGGNVFFSPTSISTALAMTYAGARTRTAEEMAAALRFPVSGDRLHQDFARLIAGVEGTAGSAEIGSTRSNDRS